MTVIFLILGICIIAAAWARYAVKDYPSHEEEDDERT